MEGNTRLALLGGLTSFPAPQHVGRPNIADRDELMGRLVDILDRRWLSNDGKYVQEFERRIAGLSETRHAIVFTNATVAMEWLIRTLGLKGEIIIPAFTFVASGHSVLSAGCKPVLADVDPQTHLICPSSVSSLVNHQTAAIMGVHLWGVASISDKLTEIATRANIPLIFDAAHAFGCSIRGKSIGSFGLASVYSFHATKFVNSLEGGAVVTNDDELAARLRQVRNFGFRGYDNVEMLGTNGKMDEFRAAVGIGSLEEVDRFIAANKKNWEVYFSGLDECKGISVYPYSRDEKNNYQYVVCNIGEECSLSRDELLNVLWTENIQARRYFFPGLHRMEPYRSMPETSRVSLAGTEVASRQVLVLPTGQSMSTDDVQKVVWVIKESLANAALVRSALRSTSLPVHPSHPLVGQRHEK